MGKCVCKLIALFRGWHYRSEFVNRLVISGHNKKFQAIPKNLPILLVSGKDDPVGSYGTGVKAVYDGYKKAGMKDLTLKLFPGDRHEILNELDKELVYKEIYQWMNGKMQLQ